MNEIRKEKKDGVANLRDELLFWLGMGLIWLLELELHQILLNFAKESGSALFMMFICALDENIRIGGSVGTQMCTNQLNHKHEAFISFYFSFLSNITGRY